MSVLNNIYNALSGVPGLTVKLGVFPDSIPEGHIAGKVIFAGGMGIATEDKPRNIMGGKSLQAEVFKVVVKDGDYLSLEKALLRVKEALRQAGYIQLSGFEHIEPKEKDGGNLLQLAMTFKSTEQN